MQTESLRYTLRFRDYWAFHCLSQLCSPITQGLLLVCAAAFGRWVWSNGADWGTVAVVAVAAYVAFWLLQCAFNALYLKSRNNRAVLAAHTVSITPEGLRDTTAAYDHLTRWAGMGRVVDYGVLVAVCTSAVDAVIVPRSAFASRASQRAWCQSLRNR